MLKSQHSVSGARERSTHAAANAGVGGWDDGGKVAKVCALGGE